MKIQCARLVKGLPENKKVNGLRRVRCESKATMFVAAYGGKSWDGYFCTEHATSIIKRRMPLIKKYKQNVVLRPISEYDKKRAKIKKGKGKR